MKEIYKVAGMEFPVKLIDRWDAPAISDARVLTMPNVPWMVQGPGCQPRTILGASTWDMIRKRCYYAADYRCEACGKDLDRGQCQAHELFSYDYIHGKAVFERCVCLCATCHLQGVHSGRLCTLYKKGKASSRQVIEGAENLFRNVAEWSEANPSEPGLRVFHAWLDFLKFDDVKADIAALIKKYNIKFYMPDTKKMAMWGEWAIKIGNREWPSPYKTEQEWRDAMEKMNASIPVAPKPIRTSEEEISKKLENWS